MLAHGEGSRGGAAGAGATIPYVDSMLLVSLLEPFLEFLLPSLIPLLFRRAIWYLSGFEIWGLKTKCGQKERKFLIIPELGKLYALFGLTAV